MPNFKKDFVERTLKVLKEYDSEYEVTLLLNCLLALVSFPIELQENEINVKAEEFEVICVNKLRSLMNEEDYINEDEFNFFSNIRNSIAHINVRLKPENDKNTIGSVTLWNEEWYIDGKKRKKPKITFRVNISVDKLRIFAEYVAEEYLKRFF